MKKKIINKFLGLQFSRRDPIFQKLMGPRTPFWKCLAPTLHPNSNASFINIWDRLIWWRSPNLTRSSKLAAAPNCWACTLHNLGWTWTSVSEKIATCSDELGHGRPRKKYRTQTRVSVNTKHQFTSFWLRPSSDSDAWTEISDVYSVNAP